MGLKKIISKMYPTVFFGNYKGDSLATNHKTLPFIKDKKFAEAWLYSEERNKAGWKNNVPDVRWRASIACWAAYQASLLQGDFVECGVHTGLLSVAICKYLDFSKQARSFYLFDTFEGIPDKVVSDSEKNMSQAHNKDIYFDCFDIAKNNFSEFPNAKLIKGFVPDSFSQVSFDKISYLSIDMNNAASEIAALEYLWPYLVQGAYVLFDDYGWSDHHLQMSVIDDFANKKGLKIALLPTGQGLLIKTV
jgi:O-methyltransferase